MDTKLFITVACVTAFCSTPEPAICSDSPAYSNESQTELTTNWQTSNPGMDAVPADFNKYYGLVGLEANRPVNLLIVNTKTPDSKLISMRTGPYGDKTILQVQYTKGGERVMRFRFCEQSDTGLAIGRYSSWQDKPVLRLHNLDQVCANPVYLTEVNEKFDKKNWQFGCEINKRMQETWDLLHSYPLIGMSRGEVIELLGEGEAAVVEHEANINYYKLSRTADVLPRDDLYLAINYENNRVSAYRTELIHCELPKMSQEFSQKMSKTFLFEKDSAIKPSSK